MMSGTHKKDNTGIYQFIKNFPRWYGAVKWLLPITIGVVSASLIAGMTTGLLAVPALLSGLGALPVLYANLSAFGAFSLLAVSTMTVAMFTGGLASLLVRASLFQMVESMSDKNYHAVEVYLTVTEQGRQAKISELEQALVEISNKCDVLTKENEVLKVQKDPSVIFSHEANSASGKKSSNDENTDTLSPTPQPKHKYFK